MEHKICRENLSAYLDGELAPRERLELETHLAGCPECAAELKQLRAVSGLVKARGLEPVPPALKQAVLGGRKAAVPWLKPALAFSAAAAALLVVFNLTKTEENATYSVGFGAREGSALYEAAVDAAPEAGSTARQENSLQTADLGAGAGAAGAVAPRSAAYRTPAVAAVRGSLAQAKFAAKADAAPVSEFEGPVCVKIISAEGSPEAGGAKPGWQVLLESRGVKVRPAKPGTLIFWKKDGRSTALHMSDSRGGFILFDGVQDPLAVPDERNLPAACEQYFEP